MKQAKKLQLVETSIKSAHEIITVPLSSLVKSPRNVRSVETDVGELASSILANNLFSPLVVTKVLNGNKGTGQYAVEAGSRRLAALHKLLEQGRIGEGFPVNVILILIADAVNASLVENHHRENMHPADKFMAFNELINQGKSILEVAEAYGLSELAVKRILKLANASSEVFQEFKNGKMNLEQLMVLCLCDDHTKQNELWFSTPEGYQREAGRLKSRLIQNEISATNKLVVYVGYDNYIARGGAVRVDLFSNTNDDNTLLDTDLLDAMVQEKFLAVADIIKADGWGWVEYAESRDWEYVNKFSRISKVARELTEAEQQQVSIIEARQVTIELEMEQLDEDEDEEAIRLLSEEADTLETQYDALYDSVQTWPGDKQGLSGVFLYIDSDGSITKIEGLVKSSDVVKLKALTAGDTANKETTQAETNEDDKDISQSLKDTLKAHRTGAVQLCVARQPNLALIMLVHNMALKLMPFYSATWGKSKLNIQPDHVKLAQDIPSWEDTNLHQDREYLFNYWANLMPTRADELLDWLLVQPQDLVLALMAFCTSLTLDLTSNDAQSHFKAYSDLFKVDMHEFWKPTADNYLSRVSKNHMLEVAKQAGVDCGSLDATKLKKSELAKAVGELVQKTAWLPPNLNIN